MQTTKISKNALKRVLKLNAQGISIVGYTVKPGGTYGLQIKSKQHQIGKYVGF